MSSAGAGATSVGVGGDRGSASAASTGVASAGAEGARAAHARPPGSVLAFASDADGELALATELGRFVAGAADAAIAARGAFSVALSGGSLPATLTRALGEAVARGDDLQTERWAVFYADERLVPPGAADSNHAAHAALFAAPWWRAPPGAVRVAAPPDGGAGDAAGAAAAYDAAVRAAVPPAEGGAAAGGGGGGSASAAAPAFDLVLLGMGPDGHTASLFPGHALLAEREAGIASITDSPKPPPARVTFTLPLLCAARAAAVVATGASKAGALAAALGPGGDGEGGPPAGRVRPAGGRGWPTFFIDAAAAAALPEGAFLRCA